MLAGKWPRGIVHANNCRLRRHGGEPASHRFTASRPANDATLARRISLWQHNDDAGADRLGRGDRPIENPLIPHHRKLLGPAKTRAGPRCHHDCPNNFVSSGWHTYLG